MSPPQLPNPPAPPKPDPKPSSISAAAIAIITAVVTAGVILGGGAFGLWWFFHPAAPTPEPIVITVDANTPPHVGRIILLHAETKGGLVKWRALTAPLPPEKFDLKVQANSHDAELVTPLSGVYRVEAITVVGSEADVTEIDVGVDTGPNPPPIPPGPGPGPGPTPNPIPHDALRVLMTYDPDVSVTSGQLTVLKSAATQKLVPTGNWRILATTQTFGDELPIWKDVFAKRKNPVGIVLFNGTDGSIAYEGKLPESMADAQALIKKYSN